MNHQQILEKLSARHIVEAIADDVSRLTAWEMTGSKGAGRGQGEASSRVVSSALLRWNCVLQAPPDALPALYRQKTALALALVLHKHGFQDRSITDEALKAVDALNDAVALSDDFFRKSEAIKAFISAPPVPLARRPPVKNATFWRAGDVASIRVAGRYFAAYVHEVAGADR